MSKIAALVVAGLLLTSCGGGPARSTPRSPSSSSQLPASPVASPASSVRSSPTPSQPQLFKCLPAPLAGGNTRTPIPTSDAYLGLAVDGNGTTWFAEANSGKVGCYRQGLPILEFALDPNSQPRTLRAAPDGSVWFAEPGVSRLGHIASSGQFSEHQAEGNFSPNWGVAVGPDGSVWYNSGLNGVGRLSPDGTVTTLPVAAQATITVDSNGDAWVPGSTVTRISPAGQVATFTFTNSIEQMAQAADGRMWFLNVGCVNVQQIGWIDISTGQPKFFDAPNADNPGFPNSIVRAPDGAVWFGLTDGRLVRLASETDVTVYSVPWSDVHIGPFVVLQNNRIVMLGRQEVLDFTPVNPTRVAGAGALPGPLPHVAADAAEGAACAAAVAQAGPSAKVVFSGPSWEGNNAAIFIYQVNPNRCGYVLIVYVVNDSGTWKKYDTFGTQELGPPTPGVTETLKFRTGCLNVHESPSLASKVVRCLGSGTQIAIDGQPAFADGYMWLHVAAQGWAVQPYLYCTDYLYEQRPGC